MADKTFTQEQVNGIVASPSAKLRARVEQLEAELGDYQRVKGELTAAGDDLTKQVQALTAERDKAQAELATAKASHAEALGAVRRTALQVQLTTALVAAEAIPQSIAVALREMLLAAELELDDAGSIAAITLGGAKHTDPAAAARAFLEAQPWFARGSTGGAGATRPSAGGARHHGVDTRSAGELMQAGLSEKP